MVPIDEFVDCLEDGVKGDVTTGDSSLLLYPPWLFTVRYCSVCCGLYWKLGVGSCNRDASSIEGTRLGLGGRCGGTDRPAGG